MNYIDWFNEHANKHKKIVDKLLSKNYSKEQIIEYFTFENMVKNEVNFCLLYKENKKCHDMENLNCYFCACPNFRFDDTGLESENKFKLLSMCDIDNGDEFNVDGVIHQDCSKCTVPHHEAYIKEKFDLNWANAMKNCIEPS